jgi:phosphotransferase system enzyme I (PtsI)/phosphotransferase system enzyme I (PtsP)
LPLIKWLLRATSVSDAEAFLAQALTMDNAQDIRAAAETLITKSAIYPDG